MSTPLAIAILICLGIWGTAQMIIHDVTSGTPSTTKHDHIEEVREHTWKLIVRQESGAQNEAIAGVTGSKTPRRHVMRPSEFAVDQTGKQTFNVSGDYWQTEYNSFDPAYHPPVKGASPREIKHEFRAVVTKLSRDDWRFDQFETKRVVDNFGKSYDRSKQSRTSTTAE